MIAPTSKSMFTWACAFMIFFLIGLLLPMSSVSAMPTAQDPNLFARRLPDNRMPSLDNEMSLLSSEIMPSELNTPAFMSSTPGTNLVQDPSFEASFGDPTYWGQFSTNFGFPVCTAEYCNLPGDTVSGPHTGSVWVWLGGADFSDPQIISPEVGYVYQYVAFPGVSCRATLQFYLMIGAAPGSDVNDNLLVRVDGNTVFSTNATQKSLYPTYQLVSIDVSAYNGGLHLLEFNSTTSGQLVNFHLDDISLVSSNCVGTVRGDYNGDRIADVGVFRPSNSTWYIGGVGSFVFGTTGDIPVPADYNGDGVNEIGIFRPSNSTWYISGLPYSFVWGTVGDIPVVADYDGNGVDDVAVFRPSNSTWYIVGRGAAFVWGTVGDIPVPADYNGDGMAEVAVFRPSNSTWYISGLPYSFVWGTVGDIPLVADYDGNGVDDVAVFRPSNSTWYIVGRGAAFVWGGSTDVPVPADYDGDGMAEVAVFRPSNGTWYIEGFAPFVWGASGDIPVSSQILIN